MHAELQRKTRGIPRLPLKTLFMQCHLLNVGKALHVKTVARLNMNKAKRMWSILSVNSVHGYFCLNLGRLGNDWVW